MVKFWQALRWPPRRLVLWHSIAAVPLAIVVVLGAYLSYHYHQLTIANRDRVDRAYAVLDVVDGLYIAVQNADVAQRDFIITGDASHLSAFVAALNEERDDAERLRVLLAASATQETNLARLDTAVSTKLAELARTIAVRREQGFDAAQRAIRASDDGATMNSIRQQVVLLADNERKFLERRQAAARAHERQTLLVGIFIAALSVATRICIALGIRHVHSRRQAAIGEAPADDKSEEAAAAQESRPDPDEAGRTVVGVRS